MLRFSLLLIISYLIALGHSEDLLPDFFDFTQPAESQYELLKKDIYLMQYDEQLWHEMQNEWGEDHPFMIRFGQSLMTRALSNSYRLNMLSREDLTPISQDEIKKWMEKELHK